MGSVFVGREPELGALGAALVDAGSARPRTIVVEGAAGVGKTALLRRFVTGLAGATVLWASGEEIESSLPYGVLDQLRAEAGAPPAAYVADPLAAGASFLDLLGERQDAGPVVVVVDDAHWADTPSLHALVFALRRLRVDRVLALLAVRAEEAWRLPVGVERLGSPEGAGRICLGGLTAADLAQLARAMGLGELAPAAARRLEGHTGGNPLYATTLLEELGTEALDRSGPHLLPAPRSFRAVVLDRLGSCSPAAQRLLEVGAVLGGRWSVAVAARLAGVEDPLAAVEEALGANLVAPGDDPSDGWAAFSHPLVRAAVYHGLGPARRSELHGRAAELVADQSTAFRHRAAAAVGPDAGLASELERFADNQVARAAFAAAGDAYLAAARVSAAPEEREGRLVEAFECTVAAGDLGHAASLAAELAQAGEGRRCYASGLLAFFAGRLSEADHLLGRACHAADRDGDARVAGRSAGWLAIVKFLVGRAGEAVDWAQRSLSIDPGASSPSVARSILLQGLGATGRAAEGLVMLGRLPDRVPEPSPGTLNDLLGRGFLKLWTDDLVGAQRDLEAVAVTCRGRGPLLFAVVSLFYLSDAEYRLGRWRDSVVHGQMAVSAVEDGSFTLARAPAHSAAAFALSALGDLEAAERHASAAWESAQALGDLAGAFWASQAAARCAQARGDAGRQASVCEAIIRREDEGCFEEPGIQPWRELYAEALVRLGRLDEAEAVLEPLEARAAERALASAQGGAARVRGLLESARGRAGEARAAFEASLGHLARVEMPFARAQAELAYGAFLRRQGRRRAALAHLEAARAALARLEARPFLARCDHELAACGLAPAGRADEAVPYLTPQELSVVHLVCSGLTNRRVAAELMLSVKTVEYHLGNVFAKLGVRSRAQLVACMAGAGRAGGGGER